MTKLKLSVAQEKFLNLILNKHPEFILECGYGDEGFHRVDAIYNNNEHYDFDRELLNNLRSDAKTAGIIL